MSYFNGKKSTRYLIAGLLKVGLVLAVNNGVAGQEDALLGLSSEDDTNGVVFEAVYTSEVFSICPVV